MKVYVNRVTGIDDAIVTMFISKGNWSRELEMNIRNLCDRVLDRNGRFLSNSEDLNPEDVEQFNKYMTSLLKWGWQHTTMLRFIDISASVDGLHRGGQDDWDSHAQRFNNRIIRRSTRVNALENKLSDFYKDKVITTDEALGMLGTIIPDEVKIDGVTYVKCQNGYVREDLENSPDALRGLYSIGVSSMFVFKVNMTEWAHVYKERNAKGHANPEVKECCEAIASQLSEFYPGFDRDLFAKIKN